MAGKTTRLSPEIWETIKYRADEPRCPKCRKTRAEGAKIFAVVDATQYWTFDYGVDGVEFATLAEQVDGDCYTYRCDDCDEEFS